MRVLDLFSGIGMFSLGLERTGGFSTVAFCECDPYCQRVLAKHWPGVPCYDDIRNLDAARLARDGIAAEVLTGGFPCQDISVAGKGVGIAGERSGLWREYLRLVRELRPQFVIVENVAALLGRGVGEILGDLAALGYDAEWHCIPAASVGAPHRRDRVWIIAYPAHPGGDNLREFQQRPAPGWHDLPPRGQTLAGDHGTAEPLADTTGGRFGADGCPPRQSGHADLGGARGALADTNSGRCDGERLEEHSNIQRASGDLAHRCGAGGWRDGQGRTAQAEELADAAGLLARGRREPAGAHAARHCGAAGDGEARRASEGAAGAMADAHGTRLLDGGETNTGRERDTGRHSAAVGGEVLADTERERLEGIERARATPTSVDRSRHGRDTASWWWLAEPGVGRVVDGCAHRVDRLRALGNALVPQIAELIGEAILRAEKSRPEGRLS